MQTKDSYKSFYDSVYRENSYANAVDAEKHPFHGELSSFLATYNLYEKKCLEIGSGRGAFQNMVSDYTGLDMSGSVGHYYHKPFHRGSATELPFDNNTFDAIWTYAVLEHVPDPDKAFDEIRRVLKNGGLLLLVPAWYCRQWASKGLPVRPYADLCLKDKLEKCTIPLRESILYRSSYIFPRRLLRLIWSLVSTKALTFRYSVLTPNYETFYMSDSDALNSMDPFEAILWFKSRGDACLSRKSWLEEYTVRTGGLVFQIRK